MIDFGSNDVFAYAIFGLILNFVFSIAFGLYLTKNIGVEEMMLSKKSGKADKQNMLKRFNIE